MKRAALLLALAGPGLAAGAPTPEALEDCVARYPGADRAAERKACFASLLAPAAPAASPPVAAPAATTPRAAVPPPVATRDIAHVTGEGASQFRRLWGGEAERSAWRVGEYQPVYFLPAWVARDPNRNPTRVNDPASAVAQPDRQATEAKFQLSFKGHLWPKDDRGAHDLWFAYTQVSHWQLWNDEASRPFRESSYEPEILYTYEPKALSVGGWTIGHLGLSLNHNSNGRGGDLSRSWNRVIAFARAERGATLVTLRGWSRFKETGLDDNPRIEDYYGRADLQVSHAFAGGWLLSGTGRHSLRGGSRSRGSLQLDLSGPFCRATAASGLCPDDSLRAYAQAFYGYAESLVDYNYKDAYFGIGFSIGGSR